MVDMSRKDVSVLLILGVTIIVALFVYTIIVKPIQFLQDISSRECISGFDVMILCVIYALWGFFIGFLVFHEMRERSQQTPNSGTSGPGDEEAGCREVKSCPRAEGPLRDETLPSDGVKRDTLR